ncbi:Unknown protein sequence, partial [Pseudomonas amygdali pv. lachrymans]
VYDGLSFYDSGQRAGDRAFTQVALDTAQACRYCNILKQMICVIYPDTAVVRQLVVPGGAAKRRSGLSEA